jgi:Ni,Fe-hydrogenase I cytochrome b subunit
MLKYSFRKYQPLSLRLWHWLNAAVILGLLGTVLLRKTLLSWRTNSTLIQEKLKEAGTIITPELAKDLAVAIRNPLWDWHIYLGFALGALLLGRIAIALFIEKKCPGVHAFKSAMGLKDLPPHEKAEALHYTLVKIGYAFFYLSTALMVVTGFLLNFKTAIGLSKDLVGVTKEIHELMMWFFIFFGVGHVLGVVIAENSKAPGLISDMIHGGDPKIK